MTKRKNAELAGFEAECAVLGLLIADDRHWADHGNRLAAADFGDQRHGAIFTAIKTLLERGARVTRPTLLAELKGEDHDEGLSPYIAALIAGAPEGTVVHDLVDLVLHFSGIRRIVSAAEQIRDRATKASAGISLDEIAQESVKLIDGARSEGVKDSAKLGDVVNTVVNRAYQIQSSGRPIGIKTGLKCFDDLVGPMLPGQEIVLGGETGAGKTALGTVVGVKVAEQGIPVHFTSLEMDDGEIASRVLAARSGVQSEKIITGDLSKADLDRVFASGEQILDLPFWIDDQPKQSVPTLHARLARARTKNNIQLAIIDHLQFIPADNPKAEERVRIMQVAEDIKAMAKRLGIPIILLSHVVRYADSALVRTASDIRRPMLRDLYGSSGIEKTADAVVFVHRPIWHLDRASPPAKSKDEWYADRVRWAGKAELVMPKRRGGKGFGVTTCWFDEEKTWFRDMEQEDTL